MRCASCLSVCVCVCVCVMIFVPSRQKEDGLDCMSLFLVTGQVSFVF